MEEEEKKNFLDLFQTGDLADIEVKKLVTELWPGFRSQPVLGRLRDFFSWSRLRLRLLRT